MTFLRNRTLIGVSVILLLVLTIGLLLFRNSDLSLSNQGKTILSPTQIQSIRNIRQWEFLSINDEELIDTVRHGFFGDDELILIYYGTLRLGIDLEDTQKGWIDYDHDTLTCILPPVKLLDEDFIDEARTQTFFERGKWNAEAHETLYKRAVKAMKQRCLTRQNIESAQHNASTQFYNLFQSMGIKEIRIRFETQTSK